jgi:hypothetical protein
MLENGSLDEAYEVLKGTMDTVKAISSDKVKKEER